MAPTVRRFGKVTCHHQSRSPPQPRHDFAGSAENRSPSSAPRGVEPFAVEDARASGNSAGSFASAVPGRSVSAVAETTRASSTVRGQERRMASLPRSSLAELALRLHAREKHWEARKGEG